MNAVNKNIDFTLLIPIFDLTLLGLTNLQLTLLTDKYKIITYHLVRKRRKSFHMIRIIALLRKNQE